ncbi:MAG: methyl-accepting chemotaxis protein, partial [Thermodesulfobacteriota bacterium]|nr:methyl-accepting chemotaxis protein [Thermodesulfobacteriota bacterium]
MFKNMKLGSKIVSGFVAVLVLLSVVAYVGYSGLGDVVESADKASDATGIFEHVLETRREEKNFIIREDKKYVKKVEDEVADLTEHMKGLKAKVKDAKILAELDEGIEDAKAYEKKFAYYVEAHDAKIVEQKVMEKIAREIAAASTKIRDDQKTKLEALLDSDASGAELKERVHKVEMANHLIQLGGEMRKEEKNYTMRHDKKYIEMAHKEVAEGLEMIDEYRSHFHDPKMLALLDKATSKLKEYQTAFDEYVSLTDKQDLANGEMVNSARDLITLAKNLETEEKAAMLEHEATANSVIIIVTLVAIILGALLAFFITRGITKPINRIIEDLNEGSGQIASASGQVSSASQSLAEGSSEQAAAIEETS